MRKFFNYLGIVLILPALLVFSSCNEDDPEPQPPQVDNGMYVIGDATSAEPDGNFRLLPARIDKFPDAVSRSGLWEAYVYLNAGSFNLVKYVNNVETTFGGTVAQADFSDAYKMDKGVLEAEGAAISATEEGLHHISFDESSGVVAIVPVKVFGVIGDATPNGWGSQTNIELKSASADEVVFEGTEIAMKAGEFKVRYNDNWSLDLTADAEELILFTNFGGSLDELEAGGANMAFDGADEGLYTVTVTYTPGAGNSIVVTTERTGDIPEDTFDPADYPWALIGAATVTGWDDDSLLTYYDWSGNWVMGHTLTADVFKYRVGDWLQELNPGNAVLDENNTSKVTDNGDNNFVASDAGFYFTSIRTDDEGSTWKLKIQEYTPEIIGDATENANFDTGIPMTFDSEDAGTYTWTLTDIELTANIFKFRINGQWEIQANPNNTTLEGAQSGEVTIDGDNFKLGTAGTYQVVISTSDYGQSFTMTID